MKTPATPPPAAAAPAKPRGRPRAFDREAVLDAAMQVFWEKGYEGASISDLTDAMGINPPSLYATFGDKEQLFLAAVDRYMARGDSCPFAQQATARGALESLLTYVAGDLTESGHPRGCLMMMAAATAANASPRLQQALADKRSLSRERIRLRIKRGIRDGDVAAGTDAGSLADFYATIISGLSQQARDGASRKSLLATVERAMQLFPEPPAAARKRKARETASA